jgi:hypothetical protein
MNVLRRPRLNSWVVSVAVLAWVRSRLVCSDKPLILASYLELGRCVGLI